MDLRIYNEDFELLGIVDTASSIIWADRFRQCGDFEIYVAATPDVLALLVEDRWVAHSVSDMVGIIEKVELATDEENGDYLTVTGRCVRSILERRVVWEQTKLSGTAEDGIRKLVTDAFITPKLSQRAIPKLDLTSPKGYTDKLTAQYTGTVVLSAVEEICAAYDYGFKMHVAPHGQLYMELYKGTDRTAGQEDNPRVIFSETFDNLIGTTYVLDKTAYRSVVLVAGEGEGAARRRVTVGDSAENAGLHRRELYVDARDVSSNDGEIPEEEYTELLLARGDTALAEACVVESMKGSVDHTTQYVFGVDYFLGDRVSVINKYGIQIDVQVLEVVRVWDENGYTCTPTFG